MNKIWILSFILMTLPAAAKEPQAVTVTPLMKTTRTVSGQPIEMPKNPEVTASVCEIAPGAELKVHKHPFPRYAYMLSGTLAVTNIESGKITTLEAGDFFVEALSQWHKGKNVGKNPVKILVIDQAPRGENNVITR
ncbi:hypothetical protein CU102_03580 [Phyllobacterium brassicacearum]|uniref:Cupin type-2 domain-containing protein n=1 Tax=Phyllobacterium brassicacearum TaxID=314235 RepID=A0A2P7BUP3_9HYPH|nr:cupin domain-containing protein [Phyllobacterium brassicacearum]PSH70183.1 hypothetical protein CU102_03580 [Phyllobacterium brassicacearum]TDQ33933.1 quercetin dioxygenase-like cupin family protein [Phyllobacterium brassicacearum]